MRQGSSSLDGPDAPIPVTAPGTAVAVTIVGEALVAGDTGGGTAGAIYDIYSYDRRHRDRYYYD